MIPMRIDVGVTSAACDATRIGSADSDKWRKSKLASGIVAENEVMIAAARSIGMPAHPTRAGADGR